jgi:hypothetical protein
VTHDDTIDRSLTLSLTSDGLLERKVSVTVAHRDVESMVVSTHQLTVTEGGSSNFTVALAHDPVTPLTVTLVSSNPAVAVAIPTSLAFTSANYGTPQTVTVRSTIAPSIVSNGGTVVVLTADGMAPETVAITTANPPTCDPPGPLPNPPDGHHNDGLTCMSCHNVPRGPFGPFTIAGTLYADPFGQAAMSQATIHLIDANHNDIKLFTAQNGNFFTDQPMAFPVRPRASKCPSIDQEMPDDVTATGGNCNGCHAAGSAAGVINLP